MLCEMRLFIPAKVEELENGTEEEYHSADIVKEKMGQFTQKDISLKAIAHLTEIQMLAPRGKIDLQIFNDHIKIHSVSHDYRIKFDEVNKCFLLPKPDGVFVNFVFSLRKAIRLGNTLHNYVVFQFPKDQIYKIHLNLPDDPNERSKILKEEFETDELEDLTYTIVAQLFNKVVGKASIVPGSFKKFKFN